MIKLKAGFIVTIGFVICGLTSNAVRAQTNGAAWDWVTVSPESQGMSSVKLKEMADGLAARNTSGLLVIRNDKIVWEWYAKGLGPKSLQGTASMAKAVVGGVSLAVAMTDGRIGLDDKAAKYVTQWQGDPRKSRITIRELGSHTSGLADAEGTINGLDVKHENLTGWQGDFWKFLEPPRDPFTLSRDITPMIHEPGAEFDYSNPGIAMLVYAETAALKEAPEKDIRALLRERVMRPIGVADAEWFVGGRKTSMVAGLPLVSAWGQAGYTARALGRLGRLLLREGDWEGKQLISREAVRLVTSDVGTPGICGIGWWSNNEGKWPELPRDAYWGAGAGHKIMLVAPSLKLIVVRFGQNLADVPPEAVRSANNVEPTDRYLFGPLMRAVVKKGKN